jgi:hypothetical protein
MNTNEPAKQTRTHRLIQILIQSLMLKMMTMNGRFFAFCSGV